MVEFGDRVTSERMHAVWHSFEPSQPLETLIEDFAGSYVRPGFLLRSSKEVYVDSAAFIHGTLHERDEVARAAIERAKQWPFVIGNAAMRLLYAASPRAHAEHDAPVGYRMFFLPIDQGAFMNLSANLNVYPNIPPRNEPPRRYLFLDLPVGVALQPELRQAEDALKSTLSDGLHKRLFSATVAGIQSMEVPPGRAVGIQPRGR